MKLIAPVLGVVAVLLGGLWLLQGLGVVHMRPILCFANCEPVEGPSLAWAAIGIATGAAGGALLLRPLARRKAASRRP
jgi:hypothetical protein